MPLHSPDPRFKTFDTLKGFTWAGPCAIFQSRRKGTRYVEYYMVGAGPDATKPTLSALPWLWAQMA